MISGKFDLRAATKAVTLPFLLRKSDIVTLHIAVGNHPKLFIGASELQKIKKEAGLLIWPGVARWMNKRFMRFW